MRKLIALLAASALISCAFTAVSYAETKTATEISQTHSEKPAASTSDQKTDDNNNSSNFTDSVKHYWNKFIDVFTGPPSDNK